MSYVLSETYKNQVRNTEYALRAYGIDDKFHLDIKSHNPYEGVQMIPFTLTKEQAVLLKKQLDEFVSQK